MSLRRTAMQGGPPPRPAYAYPRYPALDAIFDLLSENLVPITALEHGRTKAGMYWIAVALPKGERTEEYFGSDINAVAQKWINAEAESFPVRCRTWEQT